MATRIKPSFPYSRYLYVFGILLLAVIVMSPAHVHAKAQVVANKLAEVVTIDGDLDEDIWHGPSAAPLIQNDPVNGAPPRQKTEWWVAYDQDALYIAARLHEDFQDSICTRLGRRDTWPDSDWIFVNLDTFNDDRNAYSFSVNPDGVVGDSALYNDGWSDNSWDAVWASATSVDDNGWSVEMRIPFSQMNFPNTDTQVWGINFSRRYLRCRGREELFHKPRNEPGYMNRFPDLVGIQGISSERKIEALVYGASKGELLKVDSENPFNDGSKLSGSAGVDLTWGLTSNLTLNATLNPDFGQVEVDPAVVNLSDYETYFQEKRPFFVKDANTFRYGREGTSSNSSFNWMDPIPLYSRRIGRSPQVGIDADYDYADRPTATTIIGAGKLTGKIGNTSIGLMNATTARENADYDLAGTRGDQTVEPMTNYLAGRVKHTTPDGKRGVGFMFTNVTRDLNDPYSRVELAHDATVAGLDGWTKFRDDTWAVRGYLTMSHVAGEAEAIDDLQRSSRRYYQRPDASHIEYDPTRTSLNGYIARAQLNKESGRMSVNTALGYISPGYEINDMGFQTRADVINSHFMIGYDWPDPGEHFRYRGIDLGLYKTWDTSGTPDACGGGFFYHTQFANYWGVHGMLFYNPERNNARATRGGPNMRVPENRSLDFNVYSDNRGRISLDTGFDLWEDSGGSKGTGGYLSVNVKLLPSLTVSPGVNYSTMDENTQFVDNVDDPLMTATGGVRHIFGYMDYQEISFPTRFDWTFSPNLTLQAYAQPLFAVGSYSKFKEFAQGGSYDFNRYGQDNASTVTPDGDDGYLVDPDGPGGAEAFTIDDPDFNSKYLKINMVMRWEFKPGSTAYLVWTQDRANYDDPGDFSMGRDSKNLIQAPGDDIFMVKVTTYLDF
jgi:Domain of unknown function (DUF5916)/Carbohydrate family 9 binding domain-like